MAEGCEEVSYLLNPARPVLAPCMRHAQQPWSQEERGDIQMLLDRQVSLCREGKGVKGDKSNLRWNCTELLIANYTPWYTENTIGLHWVSRKGKQNLSLCWAQVRCMGTKSRRAATETCPQLLQLPLQPCSCCIGMATANVSSGMTPFVTAAILLSASPLPALSAVGTTDLHALL